jgi:hypothetical protein
MWLLLQYVGSLKAENGWFLKARADSPENLLAHDDFDTTPNTNNRCKDWGPAHLLDCQLGNPTWNGGKGQALIGAINYLALENTFVLLS